MDIIQAILLIIIGFTSAYLGSFTSGGTGGLSVGLMILSGIPPQITKATYQIGLFFNAIAGIRNFMKSGHVPKKYIFGAIVTAFFGGFIGSNLMTATPNEVLQKISGYALLFYLGVTFLRKYIKKSETTHTLTHIKTREYIAYFGQFILSIMAGYVPGSAGGLLYILYTESLHMNVIEYKALGRFTSIAIILGAIYPVLQAGLLHIELIVPFSIGMYIGGYFGSKHLIKMGNEFVQKIVYVSIFSIALYLIFS